MTCARAALARFSLAFCTKARCSPNSLARFEEIGRVKAPRLSQGRQERQTRCIGSFFLFLNFFCSCVFLCVCCASPAHHREADARVVWFWREGCAGRQSPFTLFSIKKMNAIGAKPTSGELAKGKSDTAHKTENVLRLNETFYGGSFGFNHSCIYNNPLTCLSNDQTHRWAR